MPRGRDRTSGLPYPSPVDPGEYIYMCLPVPNNTLYRQALYGVLSELGKPWTWRQTAGEDNQGAYDAAEVWRKAVSMAVYTDDCGGVIPMSCEDVADCIETNEATQTAINNIINNQSNTQITYETSRQGTPITEAEYTASLTPPNPGCDEDILFGAVSAIVDQLDKNNLDFLQIMEVGTNTRERVSTVIAAIPIIETLPVNEIIDFVDKAQNEILEHYEAQWTTALYDEYRCEIFCLALASPDCEITFQLLFDYFNNRLGAALDPNNLLQDLFEFFLLGTWAGTQVVDIMMLVQIGVWREASNWLGVSLRTLQTVGLLGANDPNHDWAVIPCDCAPIDEWVTNDFSTGSQFGWADTSSPGTFSDWTGAGWRRGADTTQIAIQKPVSGVVTDLEVYFDAPLDGSGGVMWAGSTGLTGLVAGTSSDQQLWVWTGLALSGGIGLDLYRPGGFLSDQQVVKVRWKLA